MTVRPQPGQRLSEVVWVAHQVVLEEAEALCAVLEAFSNESDIVSPLTVPTVAITAWPRARSKTLPWRKQPSRSQATRPRGRLDGGDGVHVYSARRWLLRWRVWSGIGAISVRMLGTPWLRLDHGVHDPRSAPVVGGSRGP